MTRQMELNENLLWAAMMGDIQEMGTLIAQGAYIDFADDDGYTALFETVCKANLEATRFLLFRGANPNARNYRRETPLMFARTTELIKVLAEYGANPLLCDRNGGTANGMFVVNHLTDLVEAWHEAGLSIPVLRARSSRRMNERGELK